MPRQKAKPRKTVRRRRQSTSGKIKLPLDVRSDSDLPKFLKALKSKNLTIVLVYANWCPHCHTIMPHFDAASKSPNNTITPVKINETMLEKVNNYIKTNVNKTATPINVEGYPSIIIVNNKGDKITDVEPVQDTETLTKVMENAGPLAEEAKLTTTNFKNVVNSMNMKNSKNMNNMKNSKNMNNMNNMNNNELLRNIGVENTGLADKSYETSIGNLAEPSNFKEKKEKKEKETNEEKEAREIISLQSPNSSVMTVTPPLPDSNSDMVHELEPANKLSGGRSQGGLMSAMARTAYTLAPSAVLLATSYAINKKYRKTHRKKNRKTNRKNRKN